MVAGAAATGSRHAFRRGQWIFRLTNGHTVAHVALETVATSDEFARIIGACASLANFARPTATWANRNLAHAFGAHFVGGAIHAGTKVWFAAAVGAAFFAQRTIGIVAVTNARAS